MEMKMFNIYKKHEQENTCHSVILSLILFCKIYIYIIHEKANSIGILFSSALK